MKNLHSQFLLRRFSFDKMKEDIDNIVDYELNPCEFDNVELFIYGACNMLAYRYFEDSKLSDKESEKLFPSIVNLFGEHLTKVYYKRCGKGLSESKNTTIPKSIRRRLSFENMKQEVENLVDYELNPCEFDNVGDFVTEACDILSYNYMVGLDIPSKDIDKFYFFLVDTFAEYLTKMYKQRCVEPLKESVKKIIITENRLEELTFKYLDKKFENLEQSKGKYYDIVFKFPNEKFGILGWESDVLYIYHKLIDNISSFIPIERDDIKKIIGKYVENRYNLMVKNTSLHFHHQFLLVENR